MVIHKSHTKKDLIEIIDVYDLKDIDNYRELNKDTLISLLDLHLRTIDMITPRKEYFDIEDLDELRFYLKNPSPKQMLSIKEKDVVIDKAKHIIFFCKIAGYCLGATTYQTKEEVLIDAEYIRKYSDISTIRRAIKLLNNWGELDAPIQPVITYRCQQRLEKKKRLKNDGLAKMTKSTGKFVLSFD